MMMRTFQQEKLQLFGHSLGKSRLITNLVLQLLYGKEITKPLKILVCAPSNAAVDILTKNLMEARKNYVIESKFLCHNDAVVVY